MDANSPPEGSDSDSESEVGYTSGTRLGVAADPGGNDSKSNFI